MEIKESEKDLLRRYVTDLNTDFTNNLYAPAQNRLQAYLSSDLKSIRAAINQLLEVLGQPGDGRLVDEQTPYLKLAIQYARRKIAEEQEEFQAKTNHADVQKNIDEMMLPIEGFMRCDWYQQVEAFQMPALTDFLTLKEAYTALPNKISLPESQFDTDFGILQVKTNFLPSLQHARMEAKLRNIEVAVLFVDIDDFKSFNTEFGETIVDRQILPIVMQTIEAHVYSHGTASKFGGDEYVLLLPNMGKEMSRNFIYDLQSKLAALTIPRTERIITVSVGCCLISANSFLTDAEVLNNANRAMRHAKKRKNCMAGFNGTDFNDSDLYCIGKQDILLSAKA